MFLILVYLLLLSCFSAFGATYLLLRNTPYAPYSGLLSIVFFQPLLIVFLTLLGYHRPKPLMPGFVFGLVGAGICLTLFVTIRYRQEVVDSVCGVWKESTLLIVLALAAMLLTTTILLGSAPLAYLDWWNGELVNYSLFAHYYLGLLKNPNYVSYIELESAKRYGAELFLSADSLLAGKPPLMIVEVLSAIHKISAIFAFGASFEVLRRERHLHPAAGVVANVGFAFAGILSLNHVLAFFAAQAVTGAFILISLALISDGIKMKGVQVFLAVQLLFILITYSEALPYLVVTAGVLTVEAIWSRRNNRVIAILCIFAGGLLINPVLLISRLKYLYMFRSMIAGFNVLGSPKSGVISYLASTLGFHFPFANIPPLPTSFVTLETILALIAIVCAFSIAALRIRTLLLLAIPVLLLLSHFISGNQPESSAYYKSYKTIAQLYFYIFFAIGIAVDCVMRWKLQNRPAFIAIRATLSICVLTFLLGNMYESTRAIAAIKKEPSVYRETDFRRALTKAGPNVPHLVLAHDTSAAIWDLMANYLHAELTLLDLTQTAIVFHTPFGIAVEPTVLAEGQRKPSDVTPRSAFNGDVIIPVTTDSPPPSPFNLPAFLYAISPGLHVQENRPVFETSAFRMVEGAVIIEK